MATPAILRPAALVPSVALVLAACLPSSSGQPGRSNAAVTSEVEVALGRTLPEGFALREARVGMSVHVFLEGARASTATTRDGVTRYDGALDGVCSSSTVRARTAPKTS